jgi:cation diffusion facilitator CzcD-associated flavoprotein CzcO
MFGAHQRANLAWGRKMHAVLGLKKVIVACEIRARPHDDDEAFYTARERHAIPSPLFPFSCQMTTDAASCSSPIPDRPEGLAALERRLAHDLECLGWPARAWMPACTHEGEAVLDVAIVGGGQAGLAAAAALAQQGIRALVFDRAPAGFEGPWDTTARMETLRSPKELTGPALGLPALTFRAWFEAQFGAEAWGRLDKIPRLQWMDYLRWYRRVMAVEVRNDTAIIRIAPLTAAGPVRLDLRAPAGMPQHVLARRVVLATGRDGLGGPAVPAFVAALPHGRWAHSSDAMDYGRLAGLRVGIVGAGSSAMDSAATALEAGAHSVELLIRRPDLPRINKAKGAGVPGLTQGHFDLPDEARWRLRHYINVLNVPPPHGSTLRVSRHPNAFFNFGCPVLAVAPQGDAMRVVTPRGDFVVDFLIVSTGFKVDWARRPEFAAIAAHVRTWKERFVPVPGDEDQELADSPDLGPAFEFQARTPGAGPGLDRIHCFCYPAALSHGTVSGDIPAISDGARRLASGIAGLFYREDFEHHFARLQAFAEPELFGDEWVPAPPPAERAAPGR